LRGANKCHASNTGCIGSFGAGRECSGQSRLKRLLFVGLRRADLSACARLFDRIVMSAKRADLASMLHHCHRNAIRGCEGNIAMI